MSFEADASFSLFVAQLALRKRQFRQLHYLDLVNGRSLSGFYCAHPLLLDVMTEPHFMTCHHSLQATFCRDQHFHWVMTCLFDAPNYDACEGELAGLSCWAGSMNLIFSKTAIPGLVNPGDLLFGHAWTQSKQSTKKRREASSWPACAQ